ncbi:hypothetical protein GUITHDRAFT_47211, partial [Guillardia theta CCMP2712]
RWYEMLQHLKEHKRKHGHFTIQTDDEESLKLRNWIFRQRHKYRINMLSEERREELAFLPSPQLPPACLCCSLPSHREWALEELSKSERKEVDKGWMKRFESLKAFKAIHGHTKVPQQWDDDPILFSWVFRQR